MGPNEITINAQRCCKITNTMTGQEMTRPDSPGSSYWRTLFERAIMRANEFEVEYDAEAAKQVMGEVLWDERELRAKSIPDLRKICKKLNTTGSGKDEMVKNILLAQSNLN